MSAALFNRKRIRQNKSLRSHRKEASFLRVYVESAFLAKIDCFQLAFKKILLYGNFSEAFLRKLQEKFPASDFYCGDCFSGSPSLQLIYEEEALPFDTGTFDLCLSFLSLHLYDRPQQALSEIHRVLKTRGLYLNAFLGGQTFKELRSLLLTQELKIKKGAAQRVIPMIDSQTASSLFQFASFKEPVTESDIFTASFPTLLSLRSFLKALGEQAPFLNPSPALPKSLVRDLDSLYRELFPTQEKGICVTFELLTHTGWKE